MDGKEIRRIENKKAMAFKDVKVFAGRGRAGDATYRNLVWENI